MKKLLTVLAFGVVCLLMGPKGAYAAAVAFPAKATYSINYTAAVSTVTIGHSCVYAVFLSTGTAGEYVALFDSSTSVGITAGLESSALKTRILFGSTSANSGNPYQFDPPLLFVNGIQAADSAATGQSMISYDYGDCGTN